uniref:PGG domain-containing protein n=1 Tax=Salix viminalis TaxID=40686 RepID=A0A6N2NDQ5_SALVM
MGLGPKTWPVGVRLESPLVKNRFGPNGPSARNVYIAGGPWKPYRSAMRGDWKNIIHFYQDRPMCLSSPVTLSEDTALHIAVYSKQAEPLQSLLGIVEESKNKFGNTALHEATICGNYEAVTLLVRRCPDLLTDENKYGETPLFTAAAFGEADIVAFLLKSEPEQCVNDERRLSEIHRKRGDGLSILSAAIKGQHFGLPVIPHHKVKLKLQPGGQAGQGATRDPESGSGSSLEWNQRGGLLNYLKPPKVRCWPARLEGLWNQKIKHVFALRVAKILIGKDESWKSVTKTLTREERNPLFIATRNGIEEIVWEIIDQYPYAIEKLNDEGQSILDVAVMHRQKKIFSLVKQQKVPLARLHRVIDNKGNTLLHHVADMKHYSGGTKPGPALQLQEELQWFEQVQEVIPSHYVTLRNKKGKTAGDLFKESHKEQLENAQKWIKETTQFCSTVAAGVFTIVFAAAYTVPGGSDENGKPNFIDSPYFMFFTVSDIFSLASSLTSLVVFLSLLTSTFDLQELYISLPRKLLVGITFLFFAVIMTALCFGATILILVQSERKSTSLLLSIAAFLPVLLFATMQFRLYVFIMGSAYNILKKTGKARPPFHIPCRTRGKKLQNMSFPLMEKPYRAAMRGDWKNIIDHYQDRSVDLFLPVTLSADTALHIAVYSKQAEPLQSLLGIVERIKHFLPDIDSPAPEEEYLSADEMKFLKRKNEFGNTALHEATICGNYEAVRLLVDQCADLLNEKNKYGETPLFTAAAFAEAEIVEFLFRSNPEQCKQL